MKVIIGFICIGDSCWSQMAEGFVRYNGGGLLKAYSAGTHTASIVSQDAVCVMDRLKKR